MEPDYKKALHYFYPNSGKDRKGYFQVEKKGSSTKAIRDALIVWGILISLGLILDSAFQPFTGSLVLMVILAFLATIYVIIRELSGGYGSKQYLSEFDLDQIVKKYNDLKKS